MPSMIKCVGVHLSERRWEDEHWWDVWGMAAGTLMHLFWRLVFLLSNSGLATDSYKCTAEFIFSSITSLIFHTPSLLHSRLKTYLFHKFLPPQTSSPPTGLVTVLQINRDYGNHFSFLCCHCRQQYHIIQSSENCCEQNKLAGWLMSISSFVVRRWESEWRLGWVV